MNGNPVSILGIKATMLLLNRRKSGGWVNVPVRKARSLSAASPTRLLREGMLDVSKEPSELLE